MWVRFRVPTHTTVVAYLALFAALGGGAYAVSKVGSAGVVDNSLRSKDLRDHKAVTGKDVRQNSLTGDDIRESHLEAREFVTVGRGGGGCALTAPGFSACAQTSVDVPTRSKAVVLGTGVYAGSQMAAAATCRLTVVGSIAGSLGLDGQARDSFSVTGLVDLPPGRHVATLECEGLQAEADISQATITVLGIGQFD